MGIRLTGFSTPIGGVSWEYTNKRKLKAKEKLYVHILKSQIRLMNNWQ